MEGYHRHSNPDGSEGGWVSNSSVIDPTVFIAPAAEVEGQSRISGNVQIHDHAKVIDAVVKDNVVLRDEAQALDCVLKDSVELSGTAGAVGHGSCKLSDEESYGLVISGATHIHSITVENLPHEKDKLRISGGEFLCPPKLRIPYLCQARLMFEGSYDRETGFVGVDRVGVRADPFKAIIPLDNELELSGHIQYHLRPGHETTRLKWPRPTHRLDEPENGGPTR
jgi:hypothetical protein